MRRVIAFALTIAVCFAALLFVHAATGTLENQVVITEQRLAGDLRYLEGRTVHTQFRSGDHLYWDCDYTFGDAPVTRTVFSLVQNPKQQLLPETNRFLIQPNATDIGGAIGSFGPPPISDTVRRLVEETPDCDSRRVTLPAADCFSAHGYEIYINYSAGRRETFLHWDGLSNAEEPGEMAFCHGFAECFRFPVQPGDRVQLDLRTSGGELLGLQYGLERTCDYGFLTDISDRGLYLVPWFTDSQDHPLEGDYVDGRGLYVLPWKVREDLEFYTQENGKTVPGEWLIPDLGSLQNLYPIDTETQVLRLSANADGSRIRLITEEDGACWLTALDPSQTEPPVRLCLTDSGFCARDAVTVLQEPWLLVCSGGQLVLADLDREAVVLRAEAGAAEPFLQSMRGWDSDVVIDCTEGVLTLLHRDAGRYSDIAFHAAVFTPEGLQYLGSFRHNLYTGSPDSDLLMLSNYDLPLTLD